MTNPRISAVALLIVMLAYGLNLHQLAGDSFWGDEIFTASFAGRSLAEVIRWTAADIHPPLYYLLAGAFTSVTVPLGRSPDPGVVSDWLWRFPSVAAVVLSVVVTYRLARRMVGPTSATAPIAAGLLLAVAPVAVKYGQEARMHALFMLFATLASWLFLRALTHPTRWQGWLGYALAGAATIYSMYFGFLILAAQGGLLLALLLWRKRGRQARMIGFCLAGLLIGLLYLPWWPVLFDILRRRAAVGAIEGGVGEPLHFIGGVVAALGPGPTPISWVFLFLFIAGLLLLSRHRGPVALFGLLWLALPVALPLVLGDPRALQFRYAFILPIYLTAIAYALARIGHFSRLPGLSLYLVWLLVSLSFSAVLGLAQQVKPDWRGAAAYLSENARPGDIILVGPLWDEGRFLEYYYRGEAQLLTPAAMVTNIQGRAESLRSYGGQVWAVNRFAPLESAAVKNVLFPGVVVTEPQVAVYEPALLAGATIDLAAQAVEAAYPWAAEAEAQGVLNPDPRTAQAAALRAWGDTLVAAGRPQEAVAPYMRAVDIFPGWVNGFVALGETQELVGDLPAAAAAYRQAVAFNLAWQGPLAAEAEQLVAAEQWQAAIAVYHRLMEE